MCNRRPLFYSVRMLQQRPNVDGKIRQPVTRAERPSAEDPIVRYLRRRLEPLHLRQRLGVESEGEQPVFGHGRTFFHLENWVSFHALLRWAFKASLLYGIGRRNALNIGVTHNTVALPRLPAAFEGFTILQISDPHLDANPEFPHALAERVRDLDYDICVLTGDFRYRTAGAFEPALEGLRRLRAVLREPVYAILGNHDSIRMVPAIEEMAIRLLLNESVELERGDDRLYLAGVDDPHFFRADNLENTCRGIPDEACSLLLAHSPELFRAAAHAGFDLMLSGHTHGGQIRLPGGIALVFNANCPRRVCSGAWRHGAMQGYTSVGAGSSVVDVRFNCPPEVVLHRLVRDAAQ
jgi:predicted MPP superfamily phosphohydrolase